MATYTASKQKWYQEIFEFPWPTDDSKASLVIDAIGKVSRKRVHLTIFRDTWTYQFQPYHSVDEIFDRVFGRGTGGIHVTLELSSTEGLHCYRDGENQGRTAHEKSALAELLNASCNKLRRAIAAQCERYDSFEWEKCYDAFKRMEVLYVDVETDCFERMARLATEKFGTHIAYPGQNDAAFVWSGASVHPLQGLQNAHQRLTRDACRGLDSDASRDKESAELGRYYYFQAIPPAPLGQSKDAPPIPQKQLEAVDATVTKLEKLIADRGDTSIIKRGLQDSADALGQIGDLFYKLPNLHKRDVMRVPQLAEFDTVHHRASQALAKIGHIGIQDEELQKIRSGLARAQFSISRALGGLASVQNFHTIEPFYLFRLMVKFQIRSREAIASGLARDVSAFVTGLLHNDPEQQWLFDWLRDKLVELDAEMKAACPDKGRKSEDWPDGEPAFVFYLKGGRAAKYLQDRATDGENDWDTNIIINPTLGAGAWYRTFMTLHNVVLAFLERAKRELLVKMYSERNYTKFVAALDNAKKQLDEDASRARGKKKDERSREKMYAVQSMEEDIEGLLRDVETQLEIEALQQAQRLEEFETAGVGIVEGQRENCKAELIDIGIPRRDTIEAFDQWFNVCPHVIVCPDKIPIPGHLYYIAEYVLMIREAFMGTSISLHKTPKRIVRLLEVLEMGGKLDEAVAAEKKHIPKTLAKSTQKIDAIEDAPQRRMLTILLAQFAGAYDLHIDADLTRCVDEAFSADLDHRADKAKYPANLTQKITEFKKNNTFDGKHQALGDSIGYAQWFAQEIDAHLRKERAEFIAEQEKTLIAFVKAIYTASLFSPEHGKFEELEVQFAITGAYAALLHARYGKFERMEELEPVRRIDLTMYAARGSDPATVLELIEPIVKACIAHHEIPNFECEKHGDDSLLLFWPTSNPFSEHFDYKPLVCKIQVALYEEDRPPALAFIKGLPVLNLRDTIWEAKRNAGHVEEAFTQQGLRKSIDALVDLLTRFENPDAGPPIGHDAVDNGAADDPPPENPRPPAPDSASQDPVEQGQDPVEEGEVEDLVFLGQRNSNWCWAATSLMMRKFYLDDPKTLDEVVHEALGNDSNRQHSLVLSRLQPRSGGEGLLLEFEDVRNLIDDDKPFIIASGSHYYVCFGYREQGSKQDMKVWDPMGAGGKSLQPYAWYRGIVDSKESQGATFCDFTVKERRVLVPVVVDAQDLHGTTPRIRVEPAENVRDFAISRATFRVRLATNALGEIGAIVHEQDASTLSDTFEWKGQVSKSHRPNERIAREDGALLVEIEVALNNDETRTPGTAGTRSKVELDWA